MIQSLSPKDLNRLFTQAVGKFEARAYVEADLLLDRLTPYLSRNAEFFRLRGLVAYERGNGEQALQHFQKAAKLAPDNPTHLINLGEQYRLLGNSSEAIRSLRKAVTVNPLALAPRLSLVNLLLAEGARREAAVELKTLAKDAPDDLVALKSIAAACDRCGLKDVALRLLQRAVAISANDLDAEVLLRKLYAEIVPPWHFPMMNDLDRNAAYDRALRNVITAESHVLDIGTGAGLLALMAARAGAQRVTTCEMIGPIAEAAKEIVRRNGYADRITVVPKISTDLVIGVDMPAKADILVSEILSSELLAENVLPTIAHARENLIKPGAKIIPGGISAMGRLIGGRELTEAVSVGIVDGFDLRPFNRFTPSALALRMETSTLESLSEDFEIFTFDLTGAKTIPMSEERMLPVQTLRAGHCVGLVQWIRLTLDERTIFENRPDDRLAASGWKHMLFVFSEPVETMADGTIRLRAKHNRVSLAFSLARE